MPQTEQEDAMMDNHDSLHKMIRLYGSKRLLWDSKHADYYKKHKREDLWREISVQMNVPVKDLKKKMTSLLGSYRRERSREKKSRVAGSGSEDVYTSKWFAFTWFDFLSDKMDLPNDTVDTMDTVDLQRGFEETREESTNEALILAETPTTTSHQHESSSSQGASVEAPTSVQTPQSSMPQSHQQNRKRRSDAVKEKPQNDMLREAFSILKQTSATPTDQYETFGNYVASELRKYKPNTLPHVKRAIVDILFRADLGEFTPIHNVRNISEYYNPPFNDSASVSQSCSTYSSTPTPPPCTSSFGPPAHDTIPPQQGETELQHYINTLNPEQMQ